MFKWIFFLIGLIFLTVFSSVVYAQTDSCTTFSPRLIVGDEGRVTSDTTLNVRAEPRPGAVRLAQIPPYTVFSVFGDGGCVDNYHWWQIAIHHETDGVTGWIAEGDAATAEYWVEPRGRRVLTGEVNGITRYHVEIGGISEPEGCVAPPEDYMRVAVGNSTLNRRTLFMIDHAQALYESYGGWLQLRRAITQGSYTGGTLAASFGTHDAGGAVDISVRVPATGEVATDQIPRMIEALRVAGFAAWLRDTGSLYANSPVHIHAIAVGDAELSPAALLQVTGERGYFAGWDGLPSDWGGPNLDVYGGAVRCAWMG